LSARKPSAVRQPEYQCEGNLDICKYQFIQHKCNANPIVHTVMRNIQIMT